jgi:NADH-quinone oxidoreductase subunit E
VSVTQEVKDAMQPDLSYMDGLLAAYPPQADQLIQVLQDVNARYGYLPADALRRVATHLGVPLARVHSVATFYKAFSLVPRGRTVLKICQGTACHVRGSQQVSDEFGRLLGIKEGQTTADLAFTLEPVNCVGTCALGPVVLVGERYHAKVRPGDCKNVVRQYQQAS